MAYPGGRWGTVGAMLIVLGIILVVAFGAAGLTLLKAGRDIENREDDAGLVAGLVDGSLTRTRTAVDTLIQPDVTLAEVRPTQHARRERATTYAVFGLGLVGIAAVMVVGLLLLGA
jgi:hypothetical protein